MTDQDKHDRSPDEWDKIDIIDDLKTRIKRPIRPLGSVCPDHAEIVDDGKSTMRAVLYLVRHGTSGQTETDSDDCEVSIGGLYTVKAKTAAQAKKLMVASYRIVAVLLLTWLASKFLGFDPDKYRAQIENDVRKIATQVIGGSQP
jgi:hypothetical protein